MFQWWSHSSSHVGIVIVLTSIVCLEKLVRAQAQHRDLRMITRINNITKLIQAQLTRHKTITELTLMIVVTSCMKGHISEVLYSNRL